jgi:hypothetical protein
MSFTPGPWIINPQEQWPLGELRIMSERYGRIASVGVPAGDVQGGRATATLIAAAPELLEALKVLHTAVKTVGLGIPYSDSGHYGAVLAAIAKAEGR